MDPAVLRDDMVDSLEHEAKGVISSDAVGLAMRTVPRHVFLEETHAAHADREHRIAGTIVFAPSTVARLVEALAPDPNDRALLVGAGVGYTAAVLAEIVGERNVHAIELSGDITRLARRNLADAGYDGVLVSQGDGAHGLGPYAPYDRILVETAVVNPPRRLQDQLAPDGRMVLPLGAGIQELVAVEGDEVVRRFGSIAVEPMLLPGEESGAIERNRTRREDREHAERAAQRRQSLAHEWIDWDTDSPG